MAEEERGEEVEMVEELRRELEQARATLATVTEMSAQVSREAVDLRARVAQLEAERGTGLNEHQRACLRTWRSFEELELARLTPPHDMVRARAALETAASAGFVADAVKKEIFHRQSAGVNGKAAPAGAFLFLPDPETWPSTAAVLAAPDAAELPAKLNAALGIAGEAGEVADVMRRCIFSGEDTQEKVIGELGDLLYYVAVLASEFGMSLGEVAEGNIAKLRRRHPDGFSTGYMRTAQAD